MVLNKCTRLTPQHVYEWQNWVSFFCIPFSNQTDAGCEIEISEFVIFVWYRTTPFKLHSNSETDYEFIIIIRRSSSTLISPFFVDSIEFFSPFDKLSANKIPQNSLKEGEKPSMSRHIHILYSLHFLVIWRQIFSYLLAIHAKKFNFFIEAVGFYLWSEKNDSYF